MLDKYLQNIRELATYSYTIDEVRVRLLIRDVSYVFRSLCITHGFSDKCITQLTTKLRDAGRRSPPWKPTSSRVPGRPQDGSDGNRITRWLLPEGHKFHANEINATLVEVKYYLQLLSMNGAPALPENSIQNSFSWLVEHPIAPGYYLDPIQLVPISLADVLANTRAIQSGHLHPLDRGGRHVPHNAFLMLHRSNQLQGNLTLEELISLMNEIVKRHAVSSSQSGEFMGEQGIQLSQR